MGHEGSSMSGVAVKLGLDMSYQFYDRMHALCGSRKWKSNHISCASTLRLYAAKYHAPAPIIRTGLPDIVREIFQPRATV
jgi:hypothetical protein